MSKYDPASRRQPPPIVRDPAMVRRGAPSPTPPPLVRDPAMVRRGAPPAATPAPAPAPTAAPGVQAAPVAPARISTPSPTPAPVAQPLRPAQPPVAAPTVVATPPGGSSAPVATGGAAGGTVIGQQIGRPLAGSIASPNLIHYEGKPTIHISAGFGIPDTTYTKYLRGVPADQLGSTRVAFADTAPYIVHDMCVPGKDGKPTVNIIPALDAGKTMLDKDGNQIDGSALIDAEIRTVANLGADDPIFVIGGFVHLEGHDVTNLSQLSNVDEGYLKTEGGTTHVTAYRGKGVTTNSPASYHNRTWRMFDDGRVYACQTMKVSLDGVSDAMLMKNMAMVDDQIGREPKFPNHSGGYKKDEMATADINTNLMFYRDWLKNAPHVTEMEWQNYCAENKFNAVNIGMNVPQNEKRFIQIFGAQEGAELWKIAKDVFKRINNRDMTAADEVEFTPLWEKEGLEVAQIRPWKDLAERKAYLDAKRAGTLASYTGFVPQEPGVAMICAPETTADLVANTIEVYVPFKKAGAYNQIAAMLGFKAPVESRVNVDAAKLMGAFGTVMQKMLIAEAMATAPGMTPDGFMKMAQKKLMEQLSAASGDPAASAPADPAAAAAQQAAVQGIVTKLFEGLAPKLPAILAMPQKDPAIMREEAAIWLRTNVAEDIAAARKIGIGDPTKSVEYNSPPAIFSRMLNGLHKMNKFVKLTAIALVFPAEYMTRKDASGNDVPAGT